uniref:Uncharacterized protein n=2 Tax=Oryza TaxID=4527 RepID=A0A0D3GY19_9ORYZ
MATMRERVEEAAAKALGNLDPVVPNLLETRSSIPITYDGSICEHVKRAMCRVHIRACHNPLCVMGRI